jgi:hypothetical protein
MKTWLSIGMFLLVVFVVCTARAQESEPSLGDVARQNREDKKSDAKLVLSDQQEDTPSVEPADTSLCGPPIPLMQEMYASAMVGQETPPEDELARELLGWLNQHPRLEEMDPEELAKSDEPHTDQQKQADKDLADKIAQSFTDEMVEYRKSHTDDEVQERLAKLLNSPPSPQRQADVMASAVRDEKRRRAAATGNSPSEKERLDEAVNLYAICENKRLMASQGEVDKLTKAALRAKLSDAGFELVQETVIGKR